jgi:hypothetical protein
MTTTFWGDGDLCLFRIFGDLVDVDMVGEKLSAIFFDNQRVFEVAPERLQRHQHISEVKEVRIQFIPIICFLPFAYENIFVIFVRRGLCLQKSFFVPCNAKFADTFILQFL